MDREETIYRRDVLDLAKKGVLISNGNYESVCKAINELPPVNPQEPKTDSWSIKDVVDTFKKHGLIREQEPCEDAISRKQAIYVASGYCHPANVAKELANLPPVNPTKTGHWEQYGNSWEDKFKCSECGKEQPKILCGERIIGHWSDYCPNCGCRMVEPQESEKV